MSNRKLRWWARITFRKTCVHCGELYATTTADGSSCAICARWIAAGAPDDDSDFAALDAAAEQLPYLLRRRPTVRQLNCSAASYGEARDEREQALAYDQLCSEYAAASRPVRVAYNIGQVIAQRWDETRYSVGIEFDRIRLAVTRPGCVRCGVRATTTTRLRDETVDGLPVCDVCVVDAANPLPAGGAR